MRSQGGLYMRVALSTDGDFVSAHFGRCPSFTIVDIENGVINNRQTVDNPGHQPGFIPQFLHKQGVECIVSGGMGRRATDLFDSFGIQTIVGVSGKIDDVLKQLQDGTLKNGPSLCKPGSGKGYGFDKTVCDHPQHDDQH
jgi:predicted Fe-Mo cluster-binding NifX family protein